MRAVPHIPRYCVVWLIALVSAAGASWSANVAAQPTWDGLDKLVALADEAHVELVAPHEVALSAVDAKDALLIIGPTKSLPVSGLSAFLREGGRVALLDDFGS